MHARLLIKDNLHDCAWLTRLGSAALQMCSQCQKDLQDNAVAGELHMASDWRCCVKMMLGNAAQVHKAWVGATCAATAADLHIIVTSRLCILCRLPLAALLRRWPLSGCCCYGIWPSCCKSLAQPYRTLAGSCRRGLGSRLVSDSSGWSYLHLLRSTHGSIVRWRGSLTTSHGNGLLDMLTAGSRSSA